MPTESELSLSVIVPVFNGASFLPQCLQAVRDSHYQPLELIVVNDGSSDASARLAAQAEASIVDVPNGPAGPAAARLLGVQQAKGDIVVFVDADVWLHPDALGRFAAHFTNPSLDAVFGSYDDTPPARNFVSQWKNLSHHYFHQIASPDAQTFWAGCGAVRRDVFLALNGFDLRYRGATIEDIEFGYRLRAAGHRILLDRHIQASHAKRWTAWSAFKTDLLYRGIPWMRLILRSGKLPNDLNTSLSQRFSVVAGGLLPPLLLLTLLTLPFEAALVLLLFLLLLLSRYWLDPWGTKSTSFGWLRALAVTASAAMLAPVTQAPLISVAFLMLPINTLTFRRKAQTATGHIANLSFGMLLLATAILSFVKLPATWPLILLAVLGLSLVALNARYFQFLAEQRGLDFAVTALPMQALHFFAGALAAGIATLLHFAGKPRSSTSQ